VKKKSTRQSFSRVINSTTTIRLQQVAIVALEPTVEFAGVCKFFEFVRLVLPVQSSKMQMQLIDLLTLMITTILTHSPIKAFLFGGPNPGLLVSPEVGLTVTLTVGHFIDKLCENHRSPMSISS
jgi:hypothetical protein